MADAASATARESGDEEESEEEGDEEEGVDELAESDQDALWKNEPKWKTRSNSPTRKPSKSETWSVIRRLEPDHPKAILGFTHICVEGGCGKFFKLKKAKGSNSWPSTTPGKHLKIAHENASGKGGVHRDEKAKVNPALNLILFI